MSSAFPSVSPSESPSVSPSVFPSASPSSVSSVSLGSHPSRAFLFSFFSFSDANDVSDASDKDGNRLFRGHRHRSFSIPFWALLEEETRIRNSGSGILCLVL